MRSRLLPIVLALVAAGPLAAQQSLPPAPFDMRHQVRIRIAAGETPEEIRSWLVERYGDYVSYRPEVGATTWPLFAVPVLILIAALAIFRRRFARQG